jgi:hypothetical protein
MFNILSHMSPAGVLEFLREEQERVSFAILQAELQRCDKRPLLYLEEAVNECIRRLGVPDPS